MQNSVIVTKTTYNFWNSKSAWIFAPAFAAGAGGVIAVPAGIHGVTYRMSNYLLLLLREPERLQRVAPVYRTLGNGEMTEYKIASPFIPAASAPYLGVMYIFIVLA